MTVTPDGRRRHVSTGSTRQARPVGSADRRHQRQRFRQLPVGARSHQTLSSTAIVTETVEDGYTPGTAHLRDPRPRRRVRHSSTFPTSTAPSRSTVGPQDIVTCSLYNNFVYDPGIALVKEPDPILVRGDNGGTDVTYTFTVTNTGNTPLELTDGDDSNCHEIVFIGGDTDGDGLLDLTEAWTYECTRIVAGRAHPGRDTRPQHGVRRAASRPTGSGRGRGPGRGRRPRPGDQPGEGGQRGGRPARDRGDLHLHRHQPRQRPAERHHAGRTISAPPTFVDGDTNGDNILDLDRDLDLHVHGGHRRTTRRSTRRSSPAPRRSARTSNDPATAKVDVVYQDLDLDQDRRLQRRVHRRLGDLHLRPVEPGGRSVDPARRPDPGDAWSPIPTALRSSTASTTVTTAILSPGEDWTYTCTTPITEAVLNTATATMVGPLGPITRIDVALVVPVTGASTSSRAPATTWCWKGTGHLHVRGDEPRLRPPRRRGARWRDRRLLPIGDVRRRRHQRRRSARSWRGVRSSRARLRSQRRRPTPPPSREHRRCPTAEKAPMSRTAPPPSSRRITPGISLEKSPSTRRSSRSARRSPTPTSPPTPATPISPT